KPLLARPFVHQLVDYAIGFALASAAVRSEDRAALVVAAVVGLASTAMFDGPLAAFRVFPRTAHRVVDVALAVAGTALAVIVSFEPFTRAVLILAAAALAFMSVRFVHGIRETRT
ncbi:MAG: hypothetical protein ACKOFT_07820, partial [Actinomycetota bacterium]